MGATARAEINGMRRGAETLFLGSYINKVDGKGRLALPVRFRRVLELEEAGTIYVVPSPDELCLDAGGPAFIEALMASIAALPPYSKERRILQRNIAARTYSLSIDGDGRVVLPAHLKGHAELDGEAELAGQGDYFQIWNPANLNVIRDNDDVVADARTLLQNPVANGHAS
ncbi:MAG: division/cell wall cluster transcriptional repressor MraZ [Pseudomonadota bacterium]